MKIMQKMEEELTEMKNKRIRLIAAVLTLAMAFSICAMPASAAVTDENEWAYGGMTANMDGTCYEWYSEAFVRDAAILAWNTEYLAEYGAMTDDKLQTVLDNAKETLKEQGYTIYEGTLPSNAYLGESQTKDSRIYWYTKTDFAAAATGVSFSVNWSTGTLTYVTSDGARKQIKAINQVSASTDSPAGGSSSSGGSGNASSDSDGAVLLLAGGAVVAVAAGVGLYLYTQPAVVQKIKNFFTGNSAAQQAAQTAAAESEAAAANEADVNEIAAENEAELPAEAEQAA
jgi:hypothetical protein